MCINDEKVYFLRGDREFNYSREFFVCKIIWIKFFILEGGGLF